MQANQRYIMNDLGKLKAAVIKRVPADEALDIYQQEQYSDETEFQNFCIKLEDDPVFKDLFVSIYNKG